MSRWLGESGSKSSDGGSPKKNHAKYWWIRTSFCCQHIACLYLSGNLFFSFSFFSKLKVFLAVSFMYIYVKADIHVSVADMFCFMVTVFFCWASELQNCIQALCITVFSGWSWQWWGRFFCKIHILSWCFCLILLWPHREEDDMNHADQKKTIF